MAAFFLSIASLGAVFQSNDYFLMTNVFNLPNPGFGLGLRTVHYRDVLEGETEVDWFEVISENFIDSKGRPIEILEKVAEKYPLVFHGVTMSIGGLDPLNMTYLNRLKALVDRFQPLWVSDHLCWTGIHGKVLHDLLPLPYTEESLKHICQRIKEVQEFMERPLILENPSTYLEFQVSEMSEWEFIDRMVEDSGCGLLLDINNVYVTCYNHHLNPFDYLNGLPLDHVVQIHLAGHQNNGNHIIDTHDDHVIPEVWELYDYVMKKTGPMATMIEWDDNIPDFETLQNEMIKARDRTYELDRLSQPVGQPKPAGNSDTDLEGSFRQLSASLLGETEGAPPRKWIHGREDFDPEDQLHVYTYAYHARLFDVVAEDYPILKEVMGQDWFSKAIDDYVKSCPPTHYDLNLYCHAFAHHLRDSDLFDSGLARDIAMFESELARVFHLEFKEPFSVSQVEGLQPEDFAVLQLGPVASAVALNLGYDIGPYLDAYYEEGKRPKIKKRPAYILIFKSRKGSTYKIMEGDEADLMRMLEKSESVLEALENHMQSTELDPALYFDKVREWFKSWGDAGCILLRDELKKNRPA